jgi:hypothetical protein
VKVVRCVKAGSQSSIFCHMIRRSTESTVLAGLLCTEKTTFTYVSNPPQPAQANSGQVPRSMFKESWRWTLTIFSLFKRPFLFLPLYLQWAWYRLLLLLLASMESQLWPRRLLQAELWGPYCFFIFCFFHWYRCFVKVAKNGICRSMQIWTLEQSFFSIFCRLMQ